MANPINDNVLWRWLRARPSPANDQVKTTMEALPPTSPPRIIDKQGEGCCGISDIGKVRDGNEDMFLLAPEHGLLVVADGLGGHAAGEVASALIVRTVFQAVVDRLTGAELAPRDVLSDAFAQADDAVRNYTNEHPECRGMGATLIVALISGNRVLIAHAGDTRGYLSHGSVLRRLTNDHTAVGRLLRDGLLSEDEVRRHEGRNIVMQAIMGARDVTPEYTDIDLDNGDRLMLCSDGLWDELSHGQIEKILAAPAPVWEIATSLVDRAIASGGNDNITTVVYQHRTLGLPAPMMK